MKPVPPVTSAQGDGDAGDAQTLFADGFEEAFLGYGRHGPTIVAVYNWRRCITILQTRDSMSLDEAEDFMDFNVVGSWLGPHTPVFLDLSDTLVPPPTADWTDRQSQEWREDMPDQEP